MSVEDPATVPRRECARLPWSRLSHNVAPTIGVVPFGLSFGFRSPSGRLAGSTSAVRAVRLGDPDHLCVHGRSRGCKVGVIQPYLAEFRSGKDTGCVLECLLDRFGRSNRDRHWLGARPSVHAGLKLMQAYALVAEKRHDVDEAAVLALGLEAPPGICLQGVPRPACERMLGIPAVVIGPCFIRIHERVVAVQVIGVVPRALAGHDEHQVAIEMAELREAIAGDPQVDVPYLGMELRDVSVGVQEGVVPQIRILVACGAVEVHGGGAEGPALAPRMVDEAGCRYGRGAF